MSQLPTGDLNDTKDKRNLSCDECDYKTNFRTNLKHHINAKHKNIKEFQCSHCQNSYAQKKSLVDHINKAHN